MNEADLVLTIFLGLGLAASCGFRIFVPLLIAGLAAHSGHLSLASDFEWMASTPALWAFGIATCLEVAAYWVPWVDNLLDVAATPSAVVAGTLATMSQIGDMEPFFAWTIAAIGGGGAAGLVQTGTAVLRQMSTLATGGLANPLFSTVEAGASLGGALLAIAFPLLALFAFLALGLAIATWAVRRASSDDGGAAIVDA
ncbi:MAG: DUF4126 domain-containing protein [Acidobacteriota bacterium]